MKQAIRILLLMMVLMLSVGITQAMPADVAKTVIVTEKQNGETIKINQYDSLEIKLAGNPTTGYCWEIVGFNPEVLAFDKHEYKPNTPMLAGSGGEDRFVFKALAVATVDSAAQFKKNCKLTLAKQRPWEIGTAAETFTINVEITNYGAIY